MRTLGVLVFIAGVAAVAVVVARTRTVAAGPVMEAEVLALFQPQGVTGMSCDRAIPIGPQGAVFACTATLKSGATQLLDCAMDRNGRLTAKPVASPQPAAAPVPSQIPTSGDPWAN